MADFLEKLHAEAGLKLLAADVGLTVFDGKVSDPTPEPPYVVVFTSVSWPGREAGAANALDGLAVTIETEWNVHCVGLTAAAARAVAMRVRTALLNKRPTIAGRNCGLITQDEAPPPFSDESTGRQIVDASSTYRLTTVPG